MIFPSAVLLRIVENPVVVGRLALSCRVLASLFGDVYSPYSHKD
jgi:hypothetical protein